MSGRIDWKRPASLAIGGCCLIEMALNGWGGYELLGGAEGGVKAKGIAIGGVIVAVLGAYFAHQGIIQWRHPRLRPIGATMLAAAFLCFALSQAVAWRVLSSSFQDGALKRQVSGSNLADWIKERDRIGITRPKATVEAELSLELRNTSKRYPNGDGPLALKLKSELGGIERRDELNRLIDEAGKRGRQVKAGAENMIMSKVFGLTEDQSVLVMVLLFVGLIGFFAYFGFALQAVIDNGGLGGGGGSGSGSGSGRGGGGGGGGRGLDDFMASLPPLVMGREPGPAMLAAPGMMGGNAPINVNVSIDGKSATGTLQAPAAERSRTVESAQAGLAARPDRQDLMALPADRPPADRSRVQCELSEDERPIADVMIAFAAACVVPAPGGLVTLENLFKRYRHWAGERAVTIDAFTALFPKVTGVKLIDVGGFPHAGEVALRVGAALRVA